MFEIKNSILKVGWIKILVYAFTIQWVSTYCFSFNMLRISVNPSCKPRLGEMGVHDLIWRRIFQSSNTNFHFKKLRNIFLKLGGFNMDKILIIPLVQQQVRDLHTNGFFEENYVLMGFLKKQGRTLEVRTSFNLWVWDTCWLIIFLIRFLPSFIMVIKWHGHGGGLYVWNRTLALN